MDGADFTSALYLGMEHSSESLPAWAQLTLGKPAVLEELEGVEDVAREAARLTGCEQAMLAPSTLHAFFDVFGALRETGAAFQVDKSSYEIARRVLRCGGGSSGGGGFPVLVTDGYLPLEGRAPPLRRWSQWAKEKGGLLVVDDTQTFGIFGNGPCESTPYGMGGGGSLRWWGLDRQNTLVIASMAKAFGVPIAIIAGSAVWIDLIQERSFTRVHCSPVSAVAVAAAREAFRLNRREGDLRRRRLALLVMQLKEGLARAGIGTGTGIFPVQIVETPDPIATEQEIRMRGIRGVLARASGDSHARLCLLVTARHSEKEIEAAVKALRDVRQRSRAKRRDDDARDESAREPAGRVPAAHARRGGRQFCGPQHEPDNGFRQISGG